MKKFAELYAALDETNKTGAKVSAMVTYFSTVNPGDGAWAVYLLSGRKLRQVVPTRLLRTWAAAMGDVPEWLFDECYDAVGDLAETMALLLPPPKRETSRSLASWIVDELVPLRGAAAGEQEAGLREAWEGLTERERLVLHKMITGAFRLGVSQRLVTRALAESAGLPTDVIAHRLMGDWQPSAEFFVRLMHPDTTDASSGTPYPFLLAHPWSGPIADLGDRRAWLVEWKWDGIRAQAIRRAGETFLWSRGEELVTERFPELHEPLERLPDGTVLDGEILAWRDGRPLPFAQLQKRIGRKRIGARILKEAPVALMVFDLLESQQRDLRSEPLEVRRQLLQQLLLDRDTQRLFVSPLLETAGWEQLVELRGSARSRHTEGLMLKRRASVYGVGRPRGDWWKWKVDPYSVDAVMVYAQRGSGKRASLYTDYTFAVWDEGQLVPFAKAYSGLDDAEIREVDAFVRQHTLERFGPVRRVEPQLVFELAFENIQRSNRHKSGVAVRFPRIARWRKDKQPEDADSLQTIRQLLK